MSDFISPLRSLEHPLPAGMRDLLPEEARGRRALARHLLDRFALYGYSIVTPPAFEFAEVLERGLGTLDPGDVLRFVEPESGEVAALRPDVTPQIARMIATRLRDRPAPYRLCYEGTVLRRRSGRARKSRQIAQVGIELAGVGGAEGDLEMLAVAADGLRAAGLERFTIDLGDADIVRVLLRGADGDAVRRITGAIARKDEAELADHAQDDRLTYGSLLVPLMRLHGGRQAIVDASSLLRGTPAEGPVSRLLALFDAAHTANVGGLGSTLSADLGEVRGFAYYTGTIFHVYAPGPGEAIGAGGRYDELLGRFGAPMPAVGFALDLDSVAWALREGGAQPAPDTRVVVVGPPNDPRLPKLRAKGIVAVAVRGREQAKEYAEKWGYSSVVDEADKGA